MQGRSSTWMKLAFVLLEITVCSKSEYRWWPAEILCTTQESVFSKVLLGVLICTEQEGRGFDQSSLSTGGPACVVQELPGTPAGAPYGLGREKGYCSRWLTPQKARRPCALQLWAERSNWWQVTACGLLLFVLSSLSFLSVQAHLEAGDCRLLEASLTWPVGDLSSTLVFRTMVLRVQPQTIMIILQY